MKQVLFIHSAGPQGEHQGSSGLLQYLRNELEPTFQVIAPDMPEPEDPHYTEWQRVLKKTLEAVDEGAILVGHSIGGSTLFKFLSEEAPKTSFAKVITIAAPFWGIDSQWVIEDFTLERDFGSPLSQLPEVVLFHSTGDSIVPISHMEKYAEKIPGAAAKQLSGSDHLFQDGLAEVAEEIRKV